MQEDMLILKQNKKKTAFYLIICILLAISGIALAFQEEYRATIIGIIVSVFFGACSLIFILQLIKGNNLTLTKEGFTMEGLFKKQTYRWKDIENFRLNTQYNLVVFDFSREYDKQEIVREIAKNLSGSQGGIPDIYKVKSEELVKLLNQWKEKYR